MGRACPRTKGSSRVRNRSRPRCFSPFFVSSGSILLSSLGPSRRKSEDRRFFVAGFRVFPLSRSFRPCLASLSCPWCVKIFPHVRGRPQTRNSAHIRDGSADKEKLRILRVTPRPSALELPSGLRICPKPLCSEICTDTALVLSPLPSPFLPFYPYTLPSSPYPGFPRSPVAPPATPAGGSAGRIRPSTRPPRDHTCAASASISQQPRLWFLPTNLHPAFRSPERLL